MERVVADIVSNLDRKRYDVSVWCLSGGGDVADSLRASGIEVVEQNITSYYNPLNILRLAKLFRDAKPDIIHTHTYYTNTIGRLAAIPARVPVVITHVHGVYFHYNKRNLFIERFLSRFTDRIITCSDAVKDFVVKDEGIRLEKVTTVHNGIETGRFARSVDRRAVRASLGITDLDARVIVTVASFNPRKRHTDILDAACELEADHPDIKLLFVGDGPLRKDLEDKARRLGLKDRVIFAGVRGDVPEILAASDIFVLPSNIEGFGLAAIEAMASGLPVIATAAGGFLEIVKNGVSGLLVPMNDPVSLARAMNSILDDKNKAKRMGEEGRKLSAGFSLEAMMEKIEAVYDACIAAKIKDKNRVLYLHNKSRISGGERSLLNLWKSLDRSKYMPYAALPDEGPLSAEARAAGVEVFIFEVPKLNPVNFFRLINAFVTLYRYVKNNKIDIIHSYFPRNNVMSVLAGRAAGARVIWHERNMLFGGEKDITRALITLPDRVICNSAAIAERFRIKGAVVSKVKVILNGVDLGHFDPSLDGNEARRELGVGHKKVVGIVTNLNKRKRPEYFLEAAYSVLKKSKDVVFVIVGGEFSDGASGRTSALKDMAVRMGFKDDVIFTGFRDDVSPLLAAFDVSVQVTEKEACSRAIIESMAAGKPVVAVGGGGNPELIVDGITGILVAPDDLEGLADEISGLLADDRGRDEMGKKARERAEKFFNVSRNARETEAVYEEILREIR